MRHTLAFCAEDASSIASAPAPIATRSLRRLFMPPPASGAPIPSVDLRFVPVHHLAALFLDPGVDLLECHVIGHVEPVPAHDLAQVLLPPFVRWLGGRTETENIDDGELIGNPEQGFEHILSVFLTDR